MYESESVEDNRVERSKWRCIDGVNKVIEKTSRWNVVKKKTPSRTSLNEQINGENEITIVPSLKIALIADIIIAIGYAMEVYAARLEIDEAIEEQTEQKEIDKATEIQMKSMQEQLDKLQRRLDKMQSS